MKLAILETGCPPGDLATRFGNYPTMFGRMLGPGFEIESFHLYRQMIDPESFVKVIPNDSQQLGVRNGIVVSYVR